MNKIINQLTDNFVKKSIKDKIRKVKALADKGFDGEKTTAQDILLKLKKKYGFKRLDPDVKQRVFECEDKHLARLFGQCVYYLFDGRIIPYIGCYSYSGYVKLNDADFLYLSEFFGFHRTKYFKNRNKLLNKFTTVYFEKHDLFSSDIQIVEVNDKVYNEIRFMSSFITNEIYSGGKTLKRG